MYSRESIQALLNAFLGIFTQPFEQKLKASIKAAATSIVLVGLVVGLERALLTDDVSRTALASLAVILVWMAVTAIFTTDETRSLRVTRNLSVVSFWVAVTLVLDLAVKFFAPPYALTPRFLIVLVLLLILVPAHMLRNLSLGGAAGMTLALWVSTGFLAWTLIY